jgi:hypothetical protein
MKTQSRLAPRRRARTVRPSRSRATKKSAMTMIQIRKANSGSSYCARFVAEVSPNVDHVKHNF